MTQQVVPPPPVDMDGNPETIYPISAITRFKGYTRPIYQQEKGVQADVFDQSWPVQSWEDPTADTSDPNNVYVYYSLNVNAQGQPIQDSKGNGSLKQIRIPAARAAKVNLPGAVTYPTYVIAPADAYVESGGTRVSGIAPTYLSTLDQANALLAMITGAEGPVFEEPFASGPGGLARVYPADEPRRIYCFFFKDAEMVVGGLLLQMNAYGVGAPGKWDVSGPAPMWVPTIAPTGPSVTLSGQTQPAPLRQLIPGEVIVVDPFMGVFVRRTIASS